ncbi:DNA-directed RNA polymerase subunit beta [Bacillus sp. REN10]|uniref:DNA-directed RNA polymerase subunit beta n=1 Tax=Bacillus sp. REN10 TaxID=2782541 RepID=UPI00193C6870|nr:DNA-directed RNA polymerase subunit beta [Bacillus sp. REN10]
MSEQRRKTQTKKQLTPLGRFVVTMFFVWVTATIGAIIGYSVIGDGNPIEIFDPNTWFHLVEVLYNSFF